MCFLFLQAKKIERALLIHELDKVAHVKKGTNDLFDEHPRKTRVNIQNELYYIALFC